MSLRISTTMTPRRLCCTQVFLLIYLRLTNTLWASPPFTPRNVLSQSVPANLLPLHLLSSDGQLSAEILKCLLGHLHKRSVERFLVVPLCCRNARHNGLRGQGGDRDLDWLGSVEGHVPVFVVVHIDVNFAGHRGRLSDGELIDGTETAVPGPISLTFFVNYAK